MTVRAWSRLLESFRPAPLASAAALRTFLQERAALIAQKCAIDYCRGKTGLASYALFTEEPFLKALEVCRWESFAAVLADLFIIAEGQLRPHVAPGDSARLRERLTALYSSVLDSMPIPVHRPEGWGEALASFSARLRAAAALDEPQEALDVADHSAERLFETLPIHVSMRELDEEVVYGAVRFRMIAVSQEMRRRFDAAELARQLTAPVYPPMEPGRSIARLGFPKWYERRLLEAHAWLITALLCAIYVEVALEGFSFKGPAIAWLGAAGGIFVGALIVWHGLRRFFALLSEAERYSTQSTCETCKTYAKFDVVAEGPKMTVRCRKCSHEWTMD